MSNHQSKRLRSWLTTLDFEITLTTIGKQLQSIHWVTWRSRGGQKKKKNNETHFQVTVNFLFLVLQTIIYSLTYQEK